MAGSPRVPLFIGLAILGLALCLFGFWAIGMKTHPTTPIETESQRLRRYGGDGAFPQDTSRPVEPAPPAKTPAPAPTRRAAATQPVLPRPQPAATSRPTVKTAKKPIKPAATKKKKAGPTRKWKVSYRDMRAQKISVIGTFNNWNPRKNPMTKGYNHTWSATLSLSPGEYHYQFWVDGAARRDPQNPRTTTDGKGGKVSVMTIRVR